MLFPQMASAPVTPRPPATRDFLFMNTAAVQVDRKSLMGTASDGNRRNKRRRLERQVSRATRSVSGVNLLLVAVAKWSRRRIAVECANRIFYSNEPPSDESSNDLKLQGNRNELYLLSSGDRRRFS